MNKMNVFTGVAFLIAFAVSVRGGTTAQYKDNPKADKEWLRSVLRDTAKMAFRRLSEMRLSKDQVRSEVNDFVEKQAKHYVDSEEMPEPKGDHGTSGSTGNELASKRARVYSYGNLDPPRDVVKQASTVSDSTHGSGALQDETEQAVADRENHAPRSQVRDFRKDLDDLISLDQDLERS